MDKKKQWIKPRHQIIVDLIRPFLGLYCRMKYGITAVKFKDEGNRAYLILMNHQTAFDQFFVGMTFRKPVYYLATEDIFSMGWVSDLIRWLVEPIPIKKQTTDIQAIKNCIKVAREGGTICIAPEGNRTFHGRTLYMNPSIASMAKKLGLPVALFRIEGGYGIQPRWSDVVRKGNMRSYVSRVIEPEELKEMTTDEIFEVIQTGLWVDEAMVSGEFRNKKSAEFLERTVYTCPWCGIAPFESSGEIIRCTKCGREIRHLPTKELQGIGFAFPHRFVADWYDWQNEYVNGLDLSTLTESPVWEETASLSLVHPYKRKELLKKEARVLLYGDRILVDEDEYRFDSVHAVVVLGKNKLNIYTGKEILQLKGSKRFNALKYVNFFHRNKNMKSGDLNAKFLGL